ncbi:hypothetical protein LCGC14_2906980, partial [marine sediment metagenome]
AGGMLAALPAEMADKALTALRGAGYDAADIGEVTKGPPYLTVTD